MQYWFSAPDLPDKVKKRLAEQLPDVGSFPGMHLAVDKEDIVSLENQLASNMQSS